MRRTFITLFVLGFAAACAGAPAPPGETAGAAGESWTNDVSSAHSSRGQWSSGALVTGDARVSLSDGELARLRGAVGACDLSDGFAATTPPWPAVVVEARDARGPAAVFQLQAMGLRFDAASPYSPSLASMHSPAGPTVQDCTLTEEDAAWLWELHTAKFGPTQVREYSAPDPRDGGDDLMRGLP